MKAILIAALFVMSGTAFASSTRTISADSITSADTTKTYSLPNVSGAVMISVGIVSETPTGTVNGSNTTFTTSAAPGQASTLDVIQDGIVLIPTTDYSLSGSTITMTTAPAVGQFLRVRYSKF